MIVITETDSTNSKTILFIKRFDKAICARYNGNGRNKSTASYGNVDDYIIDELSNIFCSSLTCSLFNEFVFLFGRCNNV
ncbi:unnamed protein product [Rotaria sp. Silwood1]|nr:unnamed protein product [Rotaria sp. Silwood1]